jgi:hypothetical protein
MHSALVRKYVAKHPSANIAEIVAAFKEQDIRVSTAWASKIKYEKGKKRRGRKATPANGQQRRPHGAAKVNRGGKADAIRAAFAELGRRARPRDVIAKLAEQGIRVSSSQVVGVRKVLLTETRSRIYNGLVPQRQDGEVLALPA